MDGTVLDSEIQYHKAIKILCEKYEKQYSTDLSFRLYGATDRQISETIVKELKLPISVDECERVLTDMTEKTLPGAPLMKGAERLLTHLYDSKVPTALATNSTMQAVRLHMMARPKLFAMFRHKVSVCDPEVKKGKPDPTIFLVAASRFAEKPKPAQCLVFEDSGLGVRAAIDAGMQVVMTPNPRLDREQTRHATLVIKSLLDFHPELFGLPPFDDDPDKPKPKLKRLEDAEEKEIAKKEVKVK